MQRKIVNGFAMKHEGRLFPASRSNRITYERFCFMGGLENDRLFKWLRINGRYSYYDMSKP
jgi:hypothetical protein